MGTKGEPAAVAAVISPKVAVGAVVETVHRTRSNDDLVVDTTLGRATGLVNKRALPGV